MRPKRARATPSFRAAARSRSWSCPGLPWSVERAKRRGRAAPIAADELLVVVVGELPCAMVELELLQSRERAVLLLGQLERTLVDLAGLAQAVVGGSRLEQERCRDEQDCDHRNERADDKRRGRHVSAATPGSAYRAASRRCSRGSGHIATTEPSRKTKPASQ